MSDKPHLLPGERQSVDEAHETVYHTEDEHLLVHQLVDAALPVEQQAREAAEPGVGHASRVSYCHRVNTVVTTATSEMISPPNTAECPRPRAVTSHASRQSLQERERDNLQ